MRHIFGSGRKKFPFPPNKSRGASHPIFAPGQSFVSQSVYYRMIITRRARYLIIRIME